MVLGLAVSMIFLFGALAAPVSALQTNIKIETYNQGYASGANNHTYMFVEPDPLALVSRSNMHLNEDLDYTTYIFDNTGWNSPDSSLSGGSNPYFNWMSFNGWATGPFDNPTYLPEFFDFEASDGSEHVVNTTLETRTFGLAFGQHTAVLVDTGYAYFGTLDISGQEFVHLTIDSRQDDVSWSIYVYDPEGRQLTSYFGSEGDIWTLTFKPSVSGTYYVALQALPTSGTFAMFDLMPVAVSPQLIAPGNFVTGELPTGEIVLREDTGSWVHQELAPTVHTYKVDSLNDVASLAYAFNYPNGLLPITQMHSIGFTSSEFLYGYDGGIRYDDGTSFPSNGEYFFRGGPYYVTVIGGDGTTYTLYHQSNSFGVLPLNGEFQVENYLGATVTRAYTLDIEEPMLLRANTTATGGDVSARLIGAFEDGYRVDRALTLGANMLGSGEYYLPAGEYFVEMSLVNGVNEWVEFNMGPIVSNTTMQFVDVGGFFVDTEVLQMYNMTIFLNNQDNITVGLDVTIYDASGRSMYNAGMLLANRWDGAQIQPHPTYWANATFIYAGHDWYDSHAFVGICAYLVNNNTEIPATNGYTDYPVDLTIQLQNRLNDYYVNVQNLDVSTGSAFHNFTLPLPGGSTEFHGLMLNTTPGTWYNVSVMTSEVSVFSSRLYSSYDGRTHTTQWTDLNDEYVGVLAEFSYQFGAISDNLLLELQLTRNPAVGFLYVQITPMVTHQLVVEEVTPLGPDILGILGGVVLPVGIGVGVIVVVYIVYVKKFKK